MIVLIASLGARAWDHTHEVWKLHDTPLQVIVDPTMPDAEEWLAAFQHAADAWAATPTALVLSVEMAESGPIFGHSSPGKILVLSDVEGWAGAGIPAITESYGTGDEAYDTRQGAYEYLDEADIRIGDESFVGIDEPCDGNENIREIVAIHELGHALGMGHSCEEPHGSFCEEPEASAVMYWDDSGCDANPSPNTDDLDGFGRLYDAAGFLSLTTGEFSGELPREVCFASEPNNIDADHVEWDFGDGGTGEGNEACHSFETPGEFDVEVTYFSEPGDDAPRSWSDTIIQCPSLPGPAEGAEHLFSLDTIGTQIQIHPTVDTRWECVTALHWSVLRGDEALFEQSASMSLVDVGEYGNYTVVLRATGAGGVSEEDQTVTLAPEEEDKSGCSTVHPRGGLALLGLAVAALVGRRTGLSRPESGHAARISSHFGAR